MTLVNQIVFWYREFEDLFVEGMIAAIEIGLGASGELKYPSFPERMGWIYISVLCYEQSNLLKEAISRRFTASS